MLIQSFIPLEKFLSITNRKTSIGNGESLVKVDHLTETVLLDSKEMMMIDFRKVQKILTIDHSIKIDFKTREIMAINKLKIISSMIAEKISNKGLTMM